MAESYQFIFIFLLILTTAVEFYLGQRQKNFVLKNKKKVPSAFTKIIKLADHKKAADYTVSKINFNSIELIFGAIILYLFTLGGGINFMNNIISNNFDRSLEFYSLILGTILVICIFFIVKFFVAKFIKQSSNIFQKAAKQANAYKKTIFLLFVLVALSILTACGVINEIYNFLNAHFDGELINGAFVITIVFVVLHLIGVPSSMFHTFGIETKYGFNKVTPKLFLEDQIKYLFLLILLSVIFSFAALWILSELERNWWLWLWAFLSIFLIAVTAILPDLARIFDTYTPLEDKTLKNKIEKLLKKCGFKSSGLFIKNGSLRSTHGNAFFGGFGKTKKIIFFDTLLEKLNNKEIEAVIAHELGHFKRNHVKKLLLIQVILFFLIFYSFGGLKDNQEFYNGLGIDISSNTNFLILLMLVLIPFVMFFVGPFFSRLQRKYEFEADEYACEFTKSSDLKQSLLKLYRDNASTLTPDPLYSAFYHSHPPASIRIQAIDKS